MKMSPTNQLTFTARSNCRYDCLRLQAVHANVMLNVIVSYLSNSILILRFDFTPGSGFFDRVKTMNLHRAAISTMMHDSRCFYLSC